MNRVEIKKEAKEFAFNNKWNIWKPTIIVSLIEGVIMGVISSILIASGMQTTTTTEMFGVTTTSTSFNTVGTIIMFIISVLLAPLMVGLTYYLIQLVRGKKVEINDLFSKFKYVLPIFIITFLVGLFTSLWTLLLIIPGIIYAFSVAMVPNLLADELNEDSGYMELINKSREMMKGHKLDYFVFQLSFIGWDLLVAITFGIAIIWVYPYQTVANIKFYEKLKNK